MILEVKQWPESQEVMDNPDWFWISDDLEENAVIGPSAYARVMDEREYILVEKTTADNYNDYEEAKAAHESEKLNV